MPEKAKWMITDDKDVELDSGIRPMTSIGLMSGTSLDGIDAAVLSTDGEQLVSFGPALTRPYPAHFRQRLRGLLGRRPDADAAGVVRDLTLLHAEAVAGLLEAASIEARDVDVVGFHGHTVVHRPEAGQTVQIGDGQLLADLIGIPVVEDFRGADVRAGGEGAPLAPLFHAALARDLAKPIAVVNVGGVANVTWIGSDEAADGGGAVLAFDTGPGNALIDDWTKAKTGKPMDEGGRLASSGRIIERSIAEVLRHDYFRQPPPKSLDRDAFAFVLDAVRDLSAADGAASLTAVTARTIAAAGVFMPAPPARWLICGGGRRNPALMAMLADALGVPVEPVEAVGWNGDGVEAQAFAFLAVRSVLGMPLSLPSTTGVRAPQTGGELRRPASEFRR